MDERISRRAFLFAVGAAGAAGLVACAPKPIERVIFPTPVPTDNPESTPTLVPVEIQKIASEVPFTSFFRAKFKNPESLNDKREDREILGWQTLKKTESKGESGYLVTGAAYGENPLWTTQNAFVFVDSDKLAKTYIKYDPFNPFGFEFDVTKKADKLAIVLVYPENLPGLGVYILDTQSWKKLKYIEKHVRDIKFSEDGKLIYSSVGSAFSSTIIEIDTGKEEVISWGLEGCPSDDPVLCFNTWTADRYRKAGADILSPNFNYIAAPILTFIPFPIMPELSKEKLLYTLIRTPEKDYAVIPDNKIVVNLTDDGIISFSDGTKDSVANYRRMNLW